MVVQPRIIVQHFQRTRNLPHPSVTTEHQLRASC